MDAETKCPHLAWTALSLSPALRGVAGGVLAGRASLRNTLGFCISAYEVE